jgi:hypothetical protein
VLRNVEDMNYLDVEKSIAELSKKVILAFCWRKT